MAVKQRTQAEPALIGVVDGGAPQAAPRPKRLTHKWSIAASCAVATGIGLWTTLTQHSYNRPVWFLLAIGVVMLATGVLQLATADKDGFIVRVSLSIAGALLILFAITVAVELLG